MDTISQTVLDILRGATQVVFDFDGVFTDNKVYVDEMGRESVRCDRADSLGIDYMREAGVAMLVLSTEGNPVVSQRCKKLQLECLQGVGDKESRLDTYLEAKGKVWSDVVYMGNDLNDEACMKRAGVSVAPANSHPRIKELATILIRRNGGDGVVREFVELYLGL